MFTFTLKSKDKTTLARTGEFSTPHGIIKTPVFMPVGTLGTVKTLSPDELESLGAEIILANTYHLYLRPGHELIKKLGGLHKWTSWNKPMLTDSGGFQVFSLGAGKKNDSTPSIVKIFDDGVEFRSHLDGSKHFFTPEKVMEIEHDLGADIIMAFDECAPHDSSHEYAKMALQRTHHWAEKCKKAYLKLQKNAETPQALFPIVQGVIYDDLRVESTKFCAELDLPGIAVGGLSVGEEREKMYHILETIHPHYPENKPRYLMGVGTPKDLFEGIERGIDMFDCVHITRLSRHASFYDHEGRKHLKNNSYWGDPTPLQPGCKCYTCSKFNKSYLRHLVMEGEMLGARLLTIHNLHFLLHLMREIRSAIEAGNFQSFKENFFRTFSALT
jgi:queuine tRNA-ribosyltransferase